MDDIDKLMDKSKHMDFYQRKVLESAVGFARSLRKSLKSKNSSRKAPNMMVHGGAGSGKSTVINIMKQWVHRTHYEYTNMFTRGCISKV